MESNWQTGPYKEESGVRLRLTEKWDMPSENSGEKVGSQVMWKNSGGHTRVTRVIVHVLGTAARAQETLLNNG
ncbi:MAG: hypothetical protein AB1Z31_22380 [Desulfobacterales bacterium]